VTPSEVLEAVHRAGATRRFVVSLHARLRLRERRVQVADIACALTSATTAIHQPDADTWRLEGGEDLDGDDLTVVVAFEDGVIVVTVF